MINICFISVLELFSVVQQLCAWKCLSCVLTNLYQGYLCLVSCGVNFSDVLIPGAIKFTNKTLIIGSEFFFSLFMSYHWSRNSFVFVDEFQNQTDNKLFTIPRCELTEINFCFCQVNDFQGHISGHLQGHILRSQTRL